jgi:hypothetical protein
MSTPNDGQLHDKNVRMQRRTELLQDRTKHTPQVVVDMLHYYGENPLQPLPARYLIVHVWDWEDVARAEDEQDPSLRQSHVGEVKSSLILPDPRRAKLEHGLPSYR